jgi:hypothetical protein
MTPSPALSAADMEALKIYYEHQNKRIEELEQQRLTMTNVIISLSILAFSLGLKDLATLNFLSAVALPIVVLLANVIAVIWNKRSRAFIKMHQARAHEALQRMSPAVEELDRSIPKPFDSEWDSLKRPDLQNYLHYLMVALATLPMGYFLFRR